MNFLKTCGVVIAMACVFSVLNACTPSKSETYTSLIQIKGDPNAFFAGTVADSTSGIPKSLLESENSKWSLSLGGFYEAPRETSVEKANKRQQPTTSFDGSKVIEKIKEGYSLVSDPSDSNRFYIELAGATGRPKILLENREGQLHFIESYNGKGEVYADEKIVHYSVKDSNDAFSLLVSGTAGGARYAHSYTFSLIKDVPILEKTLNTAYNFLFGQGVKMTRPQGEEALMKICGRKRPILNSWTEEAVMRWAPHLLNRLDISTEVVEKCPPFSDLNTSTINFVEGWIEISGGYGMMGLAVSFPNYFNQELADSDLFLLLDEWEESVRISGPKDFKMDQDNIVRYQDNIRDPFLWTITHEMGHSLGLSHKGKGFGDTTKTVMSYDQNIKTIQKYDIDAVQELYPLRKPKIEEPEDPKDNDPVAPPPVGDPGSDFLF